MTGAETQGISGTIYGGKPDSTGVSSLILVNLLLISGISGSLTLTEGATADVQLQLTVGAVATESWLPGPEAGLPEDYNSGEEGRGRGQTSQERDILRKSMSFNRRDFSIGLAASFAGLGIVPSALGAGESSPDEEISLTAEAIHQEVIFKATPKRVYEALTDAKQFDRVVHLSEAGMSLGKASTEISTEAGGTFSLFGGYISGRHIELVPHERIVQAWRAGSWNPGSYSIARFALTAQDSGTKLIFDHTGFPAGQARHLADGWKANYWTPLQKYLA